MRQSGKGHGVPILQGLRALLCASAVLAIMQSSAEAQTALTRHIRPEVSSAQAKFLNRMLETQNLRLDVVLPLRDQAGLAKFLQEVYDRSSSSYRHFLTVPQFTARFGPAQEDYDAVVHYLTSTGFTVVGGSRDGMDVQIEGSVTSVEAAFNVSMGLYQHPTENRPFYAPDREPTVNLPFPLWHVSGLDNYSIPRPALVHSANAGLRSAATTGSGPSASFLGSDMRAAYYGSGPLNGSGQYLGLLEYYGTDLTDLNTYFTNANEMNNVAVALISTDGTSTSCVYPKCDDTEQTLDMTQAIGMAPALSGLFVFVGSSDTAIFSSMSTHSPLPLELSSSWTWSPADPNTDNPYFEKMAAQGQSFYQAAGDSSAWSTRNDLYPSEDPYVICVGGTDLQTASAAGAWVSETAWSDGGGGISPDHYGIPSWQQLAGVITSANKGSTSYRNGPDVSANSNFTYYVCADQTTCTANEYGGTSFAAPLWAGYTALANQQAALNAGSPVGFINPFIYPIGVSANYDTDFHDITSGSNGYPAVTGYDLATGWGSMNGASLITALVAASTSPTFTISASPSKVSVVQGGTGGSAISTTVLHGFNSAITLSASGMPSGVGVSFGTNPILAPGAGTSSVSISVAASTATGTYPITIKGTGGGVTQSTAITLTVTAPDFSISASPTSVPVLRSSSSSTTVSTAALSGFNAAINLSVSGLPSGVTATFTPASISAPGSGSATLKFTASSRATTGTRTITITGTGGGKTHSTTVSLRVEI
jgi:subtilase family serine protease